MADIRIKDLTTTASSTASDDFIAVDGTTNGTRKLNAFSPTFGGNATVTGTLTVSGATGSLGSSASAATSLKLTVGVGTNASPKYRTIDFRNYDDSKSQAYIRAANRETDSNASTIEVAARSPGDVLTSIATFSDSQLSIAATTASTTTSSGALVVSGGVGVGGNITLGGGVNIAGAASDPLPAGTSGLWTLSGSGLRINSAGYTFASLVGNSASTAAFTLNGTTASTSTSSGALVVGNGTSGGLGVGGAIYAGGTITSTASTDSGLLQLNLVNSSTGTSASSLFRFNAGTRTATLQAYNDTHATLAGQLRVGTSNGDIVVIPSGVTATTFGSSTVTVNHSTASTSTSSGALVVSGGVGVAGAINCGGDITAPTTANITGGRFTSVNSNSYIEQSGSDFNYVTASTRPHVFSIGGTTRFQVTTSGIISSLPASAASLTVNSTMTFELTSNTSLKIFVRGSDGTTRSTTLTLA